MSKPKRSRRRHRRNHFLAECPAQDPNEVVNQQAQFLAAESTHQTVTGSRSREARISNDDEALRSGRRRNIERCHIGSMCQVDGRRPDMFGVNNRKADEWRRSAGYA